MQHIKFTYSRTTAGRKHYLNEDDVRVVLSRLPADLCWRLREVHFNDRSEGAED
jgi:transposase